MRGFLNFLPYPILLYIMHVKTDFEKFIGDEYDLKLNRFAEEIQEGKKVVIAVDNHRLPRNLLYFRGWQLGFEWLAQNKNLTSVDYKLLMLLLSRLTYDNYIQLTQTDMATLLGMQRSQITRSIKKLVNNAIIEKAQKGRNNYYRLNHELAYKGKNKEFKKVVDIKNFIKKNNIYRNTRDRKIIQKDSPF
ncbi:MAG: helix-turn-helix transcriptional regulator [Bacteroidota bacterium]